MILAKTHKATRSKRPISKRVFLTLILMAALCANYALEFQVMNLESEIELVEGEDNKQTEENNKKEKKEIELIEGTLSHLSSGSQLNSYANGNRFLKSDHIISIQTPPPEVA